MSSCVNINNKRKDIQICDQVPTDGWEDAMLITEEYSINFVLQKKKFCLSSLYNENNSWLLTVLKRKSKAKDSKINACLLYLWQQYSGIYLFSLTKNLHLDFMKNKLKM